MSKIDAKIWLLWGLTICSAAIIILRIVLFIMGIHEVGSVILDVIIIIGTLCLWHNCLNDEDLL